MESKGNAYVPPTPVYPNMQSQQQAPLYPHPAPPPPYDANSNMMNQTNYPPQPQYIQTVVVPPRVGPDPAALPCPSCGKQVITKLDYEVSTKTHIMAGLLCLFICWPCFWIPYVMDSCKNANHYCPNCSAFIGSYRS